MGEKTTFIRSAFTNYPSAQRALSIFENLIVDEILASVVPRTSELAGKLRVRLARSDWRADFEGGGIGIRVHTKGHGIIGFSVEWDEHADGFSKCYLWAWAARSDRESAAATYRALQQRSHCPRLQLVESTIRLVRDLNAEEVDQLRVRMDELVTEWIEIWDKAGGVVGVKSVRES